MTDLSNSLAAHREKAEAAARDKRWLARPAHENPKVYEVDAGQDPSGFPITWNGQMRPVDAFHIAANDPQTVQAFISVAEKAAEIETELRAWSGVVEMPTLIRNKVRNLTLLLDNLSSVLVATPGEPEQP